MQLERPAVGGQRMTLAPLNPLAASYSRSPPLSGRLDALAVDHRGRRTRPTTNPFAVEHDQVVIDPPPGGVVPKPGKPDMSWAKAGTPSATDVPWSIQKWPLRSECRCELTSSDPDIRSLRRPFNFSTGGRSGIDLIRASERALVCVMRWRQNSLTVLVDPGHRRLPGCALICTQQETRERAQDSLGSFVARMETPLHWLVEQQAGHDMAYRHKATR